ncbi:hypothetical protein CYMTET_23026 [Cymbomonas tetramitiformis]|uniref:Aromatic amino acid beta-eliminating lyase/threonine aldolase domain-containing protein n=1 Tax=Cymbomonas tetramitiformis TaxID=36881 RepID=A0AAE0L1P9_9CHLO|nr:hypothetical protein CYMTET_23026 [Cymbomonas tetramitiformis]
MFRKSCGISSHIPRWLPSIWRPFSSTLRDVIDLRSDTVTKPSESMRAAIARSEVGDDVKDEDTTVKRLENHVAGLLGKEAALFVPTGTMGNLLCLAAHCQRGDEVICGDASHIYNWEAGGASVLMGIVLRSIPNQADGTLDLNQIKGVAWPDDFHCARTKVVALENSHNQMGGRSLTADYVDAVGAICGAQGLQLHIDGARLLNAAVQQAVSPSKLVQSAASVSLCLSKGLGAPVGSVVAGTEEHIHRVRRLRKMVGGGMRQAGVLAEAGLIALEENTPQLAQDHLNAAKLASGLASISGVHIDPSVVETNILHFTLAEGKCSAEELIRRLELRGVLISEGYSGRELRAVTHLGVTSGDIDKVLDYVHEILLEQPRATGGEDNPSDPQQSTGTAVVRVQV